MSSRFSFADLKRCCIDLANLPYPHPRAMGFALKEFKAAEQRNGSVGNELESLRLAVLKNGEPTPEQWKKMHATYKALLDKIPAKERDDTPVDAVPAELWGSKRQLMFGKVVADELFAHKLGEIHFAFGSMLRQTGGGVGPGNRNYNVEQALESTLVKQLVGKDTDVLKAAVIHHAAVHDAGGFLKRAFRIGPGYTYAHDAMGWYDWMSATAKGFVKTTIWSVIVPSRDPLRGQVSGILFWHQLFKKNPTVRRD
jgi:hypothetical protein